MLTRIRAFEILRGTSLICMLVTLGALTAHVIELPNKFSLDGALWLDVQQNLYRGWGPFFAPFEITAIIATWALLWLDRTLGRRLWPTLLAACLISAALVVFLVLNAPVNAAFASWTKETLPHDWADYRLRWELGHAISFLLYLGAFGILLHATFRDACAPRSMANCDFRSK